MKITKSHVTQITATNLEILFSRSKLILFLIFEIPAAHLTCHCQSIIRMKMYVHVEGICGNQAFPEMPGVPPIA